MELLTKTDLSDFLRNPNQLLMLKKGKWNAPVINRAVEEIRKLIQRGASCVRSRSGQALPGEIWNLILDYATQDVAHKMSRTVDWNEPDYVLCQVRVIKRCPKYTVLRCVEVELRKTIKFGELGSPLEVSTAADFIMNPSTADKPIPTIRTHDVTDEDPESGDESEDGEYDDDDYAEDDYDSDHGRGKVRQEEYEEIVGTMAIADHKTWDKIFFIRIDHKSDAHTAFAHPDCDGHGEDVCLYYDIRVRDMIARLENGSCRFCEIDRMVQFEEEEAFGLWVEECGPIACQICISVDVAQEFSQHYQYWRPKLEDAEESMAERDIELGYQDEECESEEEAESEEDEESDEDEDGAEDEDLW